MNSSPRSNRLHIAIFGKRNVGKSSLINMLTNQDIALVSNVAGTTTDPVYKAMELLPIGPVVIIDTAGIDDEGVLGHLRVKKSMEVLNKTDVAILVIDATCEPLTFDMNLLKRINNKNIPCICVINKIDDAKFTDKEKDLIKSNFGLNVAYVSCKEKIGIESVKELIIKNSTNVFEEKMIMGEIIDKHDYVVLVTPIDKSAPKGRLILPQQQIIRDIIDNGAVPIITRDSELEIALSGLNKKPKIVITDSQVFKKVDEIVPKEIPITSFSILFARYKSNLQEFIIGLSKLKKLKSDDTILICEGCTHNRQHGDIARDKIPKWIEQISKVKPNFKWISGNEYPNEKDIKKYALIIHCGGCMLTQKEMLFRVQCAMNYNVPITNYGIFIAYVNNVLYRALEPFKLEKTLYQSLL